MNAMSIQLNFLEFHIILAQEQSMIDSKSFEITSK